MHPGTIARPIGDRRQASDAETNYGNSSTLLQVAPNPTNLVQLEYTVAGVEPVDGMNKRKSRRWNAICACRDGAGTEHLREVRSWQGKLCWRGGVVPNCWAELV